MEREFYQGDGDEDVDAQLEDEIVELRSRIGVYDHSMEQFVRGEECNHAVARLKTLLNQASQRDPDRNLERALGRQQILEKVLVPLYQDVRDEASDEVNSLPMNLVKIFMMLTMPVDVMTPFGQELVGMQQLYKEALIMENMLKYLIMRIAEPLQVPAGDREEIQDKLIELYLLLFRNILAVPNPPSRPGTASLNDLDNLHDRAILRFEKEGLMKVMLAIAGSIEDEPTMIQNHLVAIFYNFFRLEQPRVMLTDPKQAVAQGTDRLSNMMNAEKARQRRMRQERGTRHSRFGGMTKRKMVGGNAVLYKGQEKCVVKRVTGSNITANKLTDQMGPQNRKRKFVADKKERRYSSDEVRKACLRVAYNFIQTNVFHVVSQVIFKDLTEEDEMQYCSEDTRAFMQLGAFCLETNRMMKRKEFNLQWHKQQKREKKRKRALAERNANQAAQSAGDIPPPPPAPDGEAPPPPPDENAGAKPSEEPKEPKLDKKAWFDSTSIDPLVMPENIFLVVHRLSTFIENASNRLRRAPSEHMEAIVALYKEQIRTLYTMQTVGNERARHNSDITFRKLFWERAPIDVLVNVLKKFDPRHYNNSYLALIVEGIHYMHQLLEMYTGDDGTRAKLDKQKKRRAKRKKKQPQRDEDQEFADMVAEDEKAAEVPMEDQGLPMMPGDDSELQEGSLGMKDLEATLPTTLETESKEEEMESKEAEEDMDVDGVGLSATLEAGGLQDTQHGMEMTGWENNGWENEDDEDAMAGDFDMPKHFTSIATNKNIAHYMHLLRDYATNGAKLNSYIIGFCQKVAFGKMNDYPQFFQMLFFILFDKILNDPRCKNSKDVKHVKDFARRILNRFFKHAKTNPLMFAELFFYKTPHVRHDCRDPGWFIQQATAPPAAPKRRGGAYEDLTWQSDDEDGYGAEGEMEGEGMPFGEDDDAGWTPEEDAIVQEYYPKFRAKENCNDVLQMKLENDCQAIRTHREIENRLIELGLKRGQRMSKPRRVGRRQRGQNRARTPTPPPPKVRPNDIENDAHYLLRNLPDEGAESKAAVRWLMEQFRNTMMIISETGQDKTDTDIAIVPIDSEHFAYLAAPKVQEMMMMLRLIPPSASRGTAFWRFPRSCSVDDFQDLSDMMELGLTLPPGGEALQAGIPDDELPASQRSPAAARSPNGLTQMPDPEFDEDEGEDLPPSMMGVELGQKRSSEAPSPGRSKRQRTGPGPDSPAGAADQPLRRKKLKRRREESSNNGQSIIMQNLTNSDRLGNEVAPDPRVAKKRRTAIGDSDSE